MSDQDIDIYEAADLLRTEFMGCNWFGAVGVAAAVGKLYLYVEAKQPFLDLSLPTVWHGFPVEHKEWLPPQPV
jgi:hypothetical protein